MTDLLEWLLDLENIRLGRDAPLLVKWGVDVPAWILFGCTLAGAVWITLVYRRERAPAGRKIILATLRAAIVAVVVVALCQPALVLERNRVEPSCVTILVDTSQSMNVRESYRDDKLAQAVARGAGIDPVAALADHSRWDLVKAALLRDDAAAVATLLERNDLQLCTFAQATEVQGFYRAARETLPAIVERMNALRPDGRSTDLAGALRQTLDTARSRRLAAIILATDGQTTEPTSLKDALDPARDRHIPILPLWFGSTEGRQDIEVGPVRAEENVFVNDVVSVEVPVTARGLTEATVLTVRLIDARKTGVPRTGATVVSREVVLDPARDQPQAFPAPSRTGAGRRDVEPDVKVITSVIELRWKPTQTGRFRYEVEVPPLPNERSTANNRAQVDLTVLDDRVSVLYVEGYPRYEYRYLKNALLREKTIELSVLLIEADQEFVQEGADPIRRFPETPEELSRYDVVLFGDVDPRGGWLSESQMKMLLDFVGHEGGGFGLIAGERCAPHRFVGTSLERLIPVRIDPKFLGRYDTPLTTGFNPRLTKEGRRSRLFRFADGIGSTQDEAASTTGGSTAHGDGATEFDGLPGLHWLARTLGSKPGASVLAEHPTIRTLSGPMPVVVIGRFGAGKIFFQATDDTWQWRRHTGEWLHDAYWVQVARALMRSGHPSRDRRFAIRTDRRVYAYGSPIQTQVEVFDTQLLGLHNDTIRIVVTEQEDRRQEAAVGAVTNELVTARFDVHRISPDTGLFEGTYVPPHAGSFALKAEDLGPPPAEPGEASQAAVFVRVERPDLEARRPEANHEVLERIAESTGGRLIELDRLETEFGAVENRSVQIPDDLTEPLWDSRLILIVFVLMISMEWIMRKAFGLL